MQYLINQYHLFREPTLTDRFFKHETLQPLLAALPATFRVENAGQSAEGRSLNLVSWGTGPIRVFLWSQMHGDEATGTMALFDLFNFLQLEAFGAEWKMLHEQCTLFMLPLVNPDGAARFTRRTAQGIDMNRDYLQTATAEAKVLRELREKLDPAYGFNLHDQSTLWSVADTGKPASLSYLAPADTPDLSFGPVRARAANVVARMFERVSPLLPDQIGRFDDAHEPRAFGDNFQRAGMSTILIEAGGLQDDKEKQTLRSYFFLSILAGLQAIATGADRSEQLDQYHQIPNNSKTLMHLVIRNVHINGLIADLGLNYEEIPEPDGRGVSERYTVADIGDLSIYQAYETISVDNLNIEAPVAFESDADFELRRGEKIILSFRNGRRDKKFILS